MKPILFELAIKGLHHDPKNIEAVRRLLVGRQSPIKVCEEMGLTRARLYELRSEILANFEKQLAEHDLVYTRVIVSKKKFRSVSKTEDEIVQKLLEESNDR